MQQEGKMTKKKIDFKWDYSILDACGVRNSESQSTHMMDKVRPIRTLYSKYLIISVILKRGKNLRSGDLTEHDDDVDKISNKIHEIIQELPIYEAVYAIMINDIDRFIRAIMNSQTDINYPLDKTIIFGKPYHESVKRYTFLTIAATIGRYHFVKYLIDQGADISKRILMSGPWHTPLSVNECMIMSALFRWFKSGMKKKITESEMKELTDLIILASEKEPSIVSDESIHPDESPVREHIYWLDLGKAAGSMDFVKRLIPLNPSAIKALYELPESPGNKEYSCRNWGRCLSSSQPERS
jgi:hypothetical protein